jgi:hypothetical protein
LSFSSPHDTLTSASF